MTCGCAIPQRYRDAAAALEDGPYVPAARDAAIGYMGTNEGGRRSTFRCMTCVDAAPLAHAERHFGHDHRHFARIETGEMDDCADACDRCGVTTLDLSQRCQAEHEAQQERWERLARGVLTLVEYGVTANPRCRVY